MGSSEKTHYATIRLHAVFIAFTAFLVTQSSGFLVVQSNNNNNNKWTIRRVPLSAQRLPCQGRPRFPSPSNSYRQVSQRSPFVTCSSFCMSSEGNQVDDPAVSTQSLRDRLRKLTGFSFTALRATVRAATGISLTAVYASTLAATGAVVRKTMAFFLAVFPTWFRYFLQPFLVLYYMPLFILRSLTGPTRKKARETHEHFVEGWKQAVKAAEDAQEDGYWPVHVNDEGQIVTVLPPDPEKKIVDITEGVAESMEVAMENRYENQK